MKKVLFVAYYFPPMGMGGVQRAVKFVKYLPEFGWEPVVLTVKDVRYYASDGSFLSEIKGRKILRSESLDPLRMAFRLSNMRKNGTTEKSDCWMPTFWQRMFANFSPWFFLPDSKLLWIPRAFFLAQRYLRSHGVDLIFTTSPPHSAHLLGLWLKQRSGLPWIADFRDNWQSVPYENVPTAVHRMVNRGMARRVVKTADKIVTVSRPLTEELAALSDKSREDFETLFNGFDKADFQSVLPRSLEKFTITYCGTLSPILNPDVFLRGVNQAVQADPNVKVSLHVRFVGSVYGMDLNAMVTHYGLNAMVEQVGYVSHRESIAYLLGADLLLLLIPEDAGEGMVTGKLFEYLASGKPILAVAPKGEAERFVIKYGRGIVVPHDANRIAAQLLRSFELWKRGDLKVTVPRWKGLEPLERRSQTKNLASLFDEAIQKRSAKMEKDGLRK